MHGARIQFFTEHSYRSELAPDATLRDALDLRIKDDETATIVSEGVDTAIASVTRDRATVEVLWLRQWGDAGGWFVESGRDCGPRTR